MKKTMTKVGIQRRKPKLITLDTIQPGHVTWLWYPYIPIGAFTALFGRGGIGKSHIACDLAARISAGRPLPGQSEDKIPQKVLLLSAEDDYAKIMVPRLMKLDANLANIAVPDTKFILDKWGVEQMADLMEQFSTTVVFVDPLVYYTGRDIDINRSNEVRDLTEKLKEAAEKTESAVVGIGHTRKSQEGSDADTMMGSADWINSSRSSLMATYANDGTTTLMRHVKANWGPKGDTLKYALGENGFCWDGVMAEDKPNTRSSRGQGAWGNKVQQAKTFLRTILRSGPLPVSEIEALGNDEGFNMTALNRAKRGIALSNFDTRHKCWRWHLDPSLKDEPNNERDFHAAQSE